MVPSQSVDVVPEFIAHAQRVHPSGSYQLGSFESLAAADHSIAGILAWGSAIHLPPEDLDGVLTEFRRVMAPSGTLVLAFFIGNEVAAFDHKVVTAYHRPVDEFSERLARAAFAEVERLQRPNDGTQRPHAAIAAIATE